MPSKDKRYCKLKALPHTYRDDLFDNIDGRFRRAKELKAQLTMLMNDLGGIDSLSYQQRSLCKRAVFLEFIISDWERDIAEGGDTIDIGRHTQALNSLLGLFRHLGLERIAKDIPSLQDYIVNKGQ